MKKNLFPLSFFLMLFYLCSCNNNNTVTTTQDEALAASEVKSIFINSDSIHYIDMGKGDPVVFVHGALSDYRTWRLQMDTFAKNHRVIAYSRRYAWPNQQTIIDSSKQSIASHVKDLAEFLKALKLEPAHLVGISSGAFIAFLIDMEYPELVRSLTLGEPPVMSLFPAPSQDDTTSLLQDDTTSLLVAEALMNNEEKKAVELFFGAIEFSRLPQFDQEIMMMNTQELRAAVFVKDFSPTITCKDLEKIKAPVLLLGGGKSYALIFNNNMEPCLSNKEKVTLPNATHTMQMDSEFNKVVLRFIDRH